MSIFDKSNYIVNTGIIEQFFQCTTKVQGASIGSAQRAGLFQ